VAVNNTGSEKEHSQEWLIFLLVFMQDPERTSAIDESAESRARIIAMFEEAWKRAK
jgi:hypothetical protein